MAWVYKLRGAPAALRLADFECPHHGRFEAVDADAQPCPSPGCSERAPWRISAPGAARVSQAELVRGKVGDYPGDSIVMDTRPLADGMPPSEFKARRAKVHRDLALAKMRRLAGR